MGDLDVDIDDCKERIVIRPPRRPVGLRTSTVQIVATLLLLFGFGIGQSTNPIAASAASGAMTLRVVSALDGTSITPFKYLVNADNTGQTTQRSPADGCGPGSAGYPASCKWTSMGTPSTSSIVTQGDESDFAGGGSIDLADGRYLISVLAPGFKLDGAHFSMSGVAQTVTVEMEPDGLPSATIQALVFDDISPTNGAPDLPAERGLAGFKGQINDYLGQVTTDVFGNPLCSMYNPDGTVISGSGGTCLSKCYVVDAGSDIGTVAADASGHCPATVDGLNTTLEGVAIPATAAVEGKLKIPNVGPNRYALSITPPDGAGPADPHGWVQTTTLEGNHDWDAWVMEGATGLDTEFVQAGEPVPAIIFGYAPRDTNSLAPGATGSITGVVESMKAYYPPKGGTGQAGQIFGGLQGAKIDKPMPYAWASLTDLTNGDTSVWVGQADVNGRLTITGVPDGNYTLTWWDEAQNYILDLQNVTVTGGQAVDLGLLPLNGWWTQLSGYVFNDANRNGVRDTGEAGLPNFTLTVRKRENSLMDRGGTLVTTDATGHYTITNAYPMTQWLVLEAYNDRFYTTGVTYQADNQPTATTHLADRDSAGHFVGSGVDVSFLPIIGLSGTIDWGVHAYDPTGAASNGVDPRNGGIVGTVSYDTTRNELDPRYAVVEDWQPGIPGATVNLYDTMPCGTSNRCSSDGRYQLAADGSYAHGPLLNTYVTEQWQQPSGCVARDINGNALMHGTDEQVLPTDASAPCLEGPLMGVQFENGFANVDGNYGFSDGCYAPNVLDTTDPANPTCTDPNGAVGNDAFVKLPGGHDYIVEPVIPDDANGKKLADGVTPAKTYKVTREEDINIANGDTFIPQVPPPACAGALHTVDLNNFGGNVAATPGDPDTPYPATTITTTGGGTINVPASTPTDNATFLDIGGTPYEGLAKPLCNQKLVTLNNGKSIVPTFNWFTDVPIPVRFWGLAVDDLNFSADPKSLLYGEKAGIPFAPVGIYEYATRVVDGKTVPSERLAYTAESDYNGLFDVLMPSTNRINCPTPSGVCANVYRFVGNDPGVPGQLNLNYKPQYRTIAAEFEALPGLLVPADLAPTQVGVSVQLPGGQINQVQCALAATAPQLYAVSQPYASAGGSFTIRGVGFGATRGTGSVQFNGSPMPASAITSWSDTRIDVTVPAAQPAGRYQLSVVKTDGQKTVNGITFHVRGAGYNPRVFEVGPGKTYQPVNSLPAAANHAIQDAIDAANQPGDLVVVYPGVVDPNPRGNPRGAYFENLIITTPIFLQGVGPGDPSGNAAAAGSILDGSAYAGDSPVSTAWLGKVAGLNWVGNQTVNDGAVITLFAPAVDTFAATGASIDGFDIRGGDQQGFPGNINAIGGTTTGLPNGIVTQGGAIFANASIQNLAITNNVVQNNGGGYGTIRIGTPDLPVADNDNDNVRIANNRIIQNAGTNLAGGVGLFAGANNYEVANNDICGNFSAEYGGGVSVYGLSPGGRIHDNRIYHNASYDEGGGVMIAGQLPADTTQLSPGSGPVDIYNNVIQANLANDDGGGLRFLMAGNFPMNVFNNTIVNNVSTHEGGGVGLNDAPNVRFYNNTVMKNLATATAATSNGLPAPAGLSTSRNSELLQATLPAGSPTFSNPLLFNDIFWDNRAGTRAGATVTGLGQVGDLTPVNHWDLGTADGSGLLAPTNSVLQTTAGTVASGTNIVGADPGVAGTTDIGVTFQVWRNNPAFVGAILVGVDLPPQPGDYHLAAGSPAINTGAASKSGVNAPAFDIDTFARPFPTGGAFDIGSDEYGNTTQFTDLSITKTDNALVVARGQQVTYTIVASNAGPAAASGATVADTVPAALTGVTWTCAGTGAGNSCATASGTGSNVNVAVTLAAGGSATLTVTGTVSATAAIGSSIANTATINAPAANVDPNSANNSATDTDTVGVDVAITKTDGRTTTAAGTILTYTVAVSKSSTGAVNGATVNDAVPAGVAAMSWTCTAVGGGSSCGGGSGSGAIVNKAINLGNVATAQVVFTITARLATNATGTVANTATVTPPATAPDPNPANNSATDTDTVTAAPAAPTLAVLDNFNRTNANNLNAGAPAGVSWSQVVLAGTAAVRVNGNGAYCTLGGLCPAGPAIWNGVGANYTNSQGAGLTFTSAPATGSGVLLRVNASAGNLPTNYIAATYNTAAGGSITVATNAGTAGSIPVSFAINDVLTARTDTTGTTVFIYKNGTYVGGVNITTGAGAWTPAAPGGRVGIVLANNQRADNFSGANLP